MADSYLTFAADYDWLFDDDVLTDGGAINYPAAARLLQRASRGQAVFDASCGTGINVAVLARRGRRCLSFYVWEIPGRLQDEHVAHIVFVFEDGNRVETREYPISFRPFTVAELRERLELAGLREVDTDSTTPATSTA